MNAVIIIPARWESSRFPGKPLAMIAGKTLIQRVWEQCTKTGFSTYVATDDERIVDYCQKYDISYMLTSKDCMTGTDRVCEAYGRMGGDFKTIINIFYRY